MVPTQNLETLKVALSECDDLWELEVIPVKSKNTDLTPVLLIFLSSKASNYIPHLNEAGFQEFRLPERFTPAKEILRHKEHITRLKIEIKQCVNSISDKARYVKALRLALDNVACEISRLEKENEALATRTTVVIEGWIPLDDFPDLKHKLERFGTVYIEIIDAPEDEEAPVMLSNGSFATPFEVVTELYATPQGKEYDPTPFLAPFFALYFGVCLTDAGYGLVLLIACMLLLKRLRPAGGTKKLLVTLGICGGSTIILGLLTGGFFGITSSSDPVKAAFPALNNFLVSMQKSAIGFDPMTDTMFFFKLVLVFGVIHVSLGYLIKAWWNIQNNKAADAFYDQFSWLSIITGAMFLAVNYLGLLPYASVQYAGIGFMILGSLIVLIYAGRENDGLVGRIGGGLFELYGITGIFGDVLSYARLLALGMATGVIAGVINTIAFMVLDVPFGIGYLLFVIIFVTGHLSNIAINTMGAFVHTLRLQFVEFFTKFYEGGGEPFSPLTEEREFTFIRERKTQP
jgi:V/A-type H+-transporting ATPase subunit I